jgi:hypothetical protein
VNSKLNNQWFVYTCYTGDDDSYKFHCNRIVEVG